mmetsp:Transcript_17468/g.38053  ORF Transcript_17468/g.38053 Transcript_17468/m.38053 type:complete len:405 (-) Transcript_17468:62-1276(-)
MIAIVVLPLRLLVPTPAIVPVPVPGVIIHRLLRRRHHGIVLLEPIRKRSKVLPRLIPAPQIQVALPPVALVEHVPKRQIQSVIGGTGVRHVRRGDARGVHQRPSGIPPHALLEGILVDVFEGAHRLGTEAHLGLHGLLLPSLFLRLLLVLVLVLVVSLLFLAGELGEVDGKGGVAVRRRRRPASVVASAAAVRRKALVGRPPGTSPGAGRGILMRQQHLGGGDALRFLHHHGRRVIRPGRGHLKRRRPGLLLWMMLLLLLLLPMMPSSSVVVITPASQIAKPRIPLLLLRFPHRPQLTRPLRRIGKRHGRVLLHLAHLRHGRDLGRRLKVGAGSDAQCRSEGGEGRVVVVVVGGGGGVVGRHAEGIVQTSGIVVATTTATDDGSTSQIEKIGLASSQSSTSGRR